MTTYVLYNAKGGVGKTTSAVNLSYLSAEEGTRTLLWDLDPQGSVSLFFGVAPEGDGGMKRLVRGEQAVEDITRPTAYANLDVIPADISARKLDIYLHDVKGSKGRLRLLLDGLAERYGAVFLDSPPGFSLLADNLFKASDVILVPMIPAILSIRTYLKIIDYLEKKGLDRTGLLPFFTLVDLRKSMHRDILSSALERESAFLKAAIPSSSDVERMGARCAPLFTYSAGSRAAQAYRALWKGIKTIVLDRKGQLSQFYCLSEN